MAGAFRTEKYNYTGDVLRVTEPAQHAAFARSVEHLGWYPGRQPGRADVPGCDSVHIDIGRAQLDCCRSSQSEDAGFGGGVVREPELAADAMDRADVDDFAVLVGPHDRRDGADHVKGAAEIGLDHFVPFLVFHAPQRAVARDAGVVDEDVNVAQDVNGFFDKAVHERAVADVTGATEDFHFHLPQLGGGPLGLLFDPAIAVVEIVEGYVRAMAGQLEHDRAADARSAARDNRTSAPQIV